MNSHSPTEHRYMKPALALLTGAIATGLAASPAAATAVSVTGGTMTMDLDRNVWASLNYGSTTPDLFDPGQYSPGVYDPGMYLEEFFDQATAATVPGSQRNSHQGVPGFGEIPATGLQYGVNGPAVTNLAGNHAQPTNFTFDTADPAGTASGAVGFGGWMRFRGTWAAPDYESSYFAFGEFTLEYDPALAVDGASGWSLWNHVSFRAHSFDLFNLTTTVGANSLTLSGDFRFSPGTGSAFFAPEDAGKDLGNVTIQLATVPVPAAAWLFGSALAGLGVIGRRGTVPAA